jgi:hypothetical protein
VIGYDTEVDTEVRAARTGEPPSTGVIERRHGQPRALTAVRKWREPALKCSRLAAPASATPFGRACRRRSEVLPD